MYVVFCYKAKMSDHEGTAADANTPLLGPATAADVELGMSMSQNNELNRLFNQVVQLYQMLVHNCQRHLLQLQVVLQLRILFQIANVKKLITDLQGNVEHVSSLHSQILSAPNPDESKESHKKCVLSLQKHVVLVQYSL